MRTLKILTTMIAPIVIIACTNSRGNDSMKAAPSAAAAVNIPELPKRTAEFGDPAEYDHLLDTYDKAKIELRKDPKNNGAWLKLVEVFITDARVTGNAGKDYDAATSILDEIIAGSAKPAVREQAVTLKGVIRLSQHRFDEALALGQEAVKLDPHRAFNYGILVDANTEMGRYDTAVAMCDRMVGIRPDLRSYSRISYQREIHGDIPGAKQAMDMAVKAGVPGAEETSWCLVQLGGLYERSGDLKKAEGCYRNAIEQRSNYAFALAALGRIEGKQKKYADAERDIDAALKLMPDYAFHEELARVLKAQNKNDLYAAEVKSAEDALTGMTMNVDDPSKNGQGHSHRTGLEMARFLIEFKNDLDGALKQAQLEEKHRPDNIDVQTVLAAIHYAKGEYAEAKKYIDLAQRTGRKDAYMRCVAGMIAMKSGDAKAGKAMIAASFKSDPYQEHALVTVARKAI